MMARITITPTDTRCSVDEVGYSGVDMSTVPADIHAVQWYDVEGWIEYKVNDQGIKPDNEVITSMAPFEAVLASWATIDYNHKNPPAPPPPTAQQNKDMAGILLMQTDWTQIPSVSDPAQSNPYLTNADAFATYRSAIRDIAINPVEGYIDWPKKPDPVWSVAP